MSLLSLSLAAAAADAPIYWVDLGLKTYLFDRVLHLRWYSLAYLAGILLGYWHLSRMIKAPGAPLAQRHADDLFFYCTLGIILGGRLGYATFYAPELWAIPAELLQAVERRHELPRRTCGHGPGDRLGFVARRPELSCAWPITSRSACRSACCSAAWPTS
jgi:hypothetical protein